MRMFVRVQMRRIDSCSPNFLDLRAQLPFDFLARNHSGAKFGDEHRQRIRQIAVRIDQRRNIFPPRDALPADQNQMAAHSQLGIRTGSLHCIVECRTVRHQRRTGENSFAMRANNSLIHAARHSKIIGVEN